MTVTDSLPATLRAHLRDRASSWSIGGHGAIAEFHWRPDDHPAESTAEPAGALSVLSTAGGLRIDLREDVVPHAYQRPSRHPGRWLQGISLCLPWRRARRAARTRLTELGPDRQALRRRDRRAVLFDLGLGLPHVDACVRSDSPELLDALRAGAGERLLAPGNPLMHLLVEASPHRVFLSQLGRVEVYAPIARPGERLATPPGPHTHVLPRLLAARRPDAERDDAPAYHRACLYLYPKHPLMDSRGRRKTYDTDAHARFTALMQHWGDPAHLDERRRALHALGAGTDPRRYRPPENPRARRALRVAIREHAEQCGETELISAWRRRFDRRSAPRNPQGAH